MIHAAFNPLETKFPIQVSREVTTRGFYRCMKYPSAGIWSLSIQVVLLPKGKIMGKEQDIGPAFTSNIRDPSAGGVA